MKIFINICMQLTFFPKKSVINNCLVEAMYFRWDSANSENKMLGLLLSQMLCL